MKTLTPRNYKRLLDHVLTKGSKVSVGGNLTFEIPSMNLVVRNPRDRLIICDGRKINFPFGIAEWIGLLTGEDRVSFFSSFIKGYGAYSSDGKMIDGSYGPRVAPQINGIIKELQRDPSSRRAVISIYSGRGDLYGEGGVNTPCTLSMQYLIRDGKLHAITTMRSNDAILGFTFDLIMFTMLQEWFASALSLKLGSYYHNAGSFHIYERDLETAANLTHHHWPFVMNPMPELSMEHILQLRDAYESVEQGNLFLDCIYGLPPYLKDLAWAARLFVTRKDQESAIYAYKSIEDKTIRKIMRPWFS